MNNRLDVEMHARGIARSRSAAADLIQRGKVRVGGKIALKASQSVGPDDAIVLDAGHSFVSRAAEKLAFALDTFEIDPRGLAAIDIGSSTGGFTDCLLQRGAARVVAVDVGTHQLDQSLRDDPRVEVHEQTDVRAFSLPDRVDLAVADVSFISLEPLLPKISEFLKPKGRAVVLVKPQFEVGKEVADLHKGVITDEAERQSAVDKIRKAAKKAGFKVLAEAVSPLEGEKGNREFLLFLTR